MTSGNDGQTGPTGATGNGIASITKTGTSGLVDTYTITYTNGNTTTFTVTNGEDANITRTEFEELKQENEDLKNNQLTKEESGQSIYLSDSADSRVRSIGLSGNSEQESTTGKNIAYVTNTVGDKIAFDNSQIITYSSGATASNFVNLEQNTLEANQEYIFEMFLTSTTQNTAQSELVLRDINNTALFDIYKTINNSSLYYSYNFTPTANTTLYRLQLYNNTATPLTGDVKFKLQIRKSNTTGGYEPYTGGQAAPSPIYPFEIHSTGNNVNLLSLQDGTYTNEVTATVINGEITLNGTANANRFIPIPFKDSLNLINGNTYTISANNNVSNSDIRLRINETGSYDNILSSTNANKTITYDSSIPIYGDALRIRIASGTTLDNFKIKPKLEQGTKATPYSPYGCGNVNEKVQNKNLFDESILEQYKIDEDDEAYIFNNHTLYKQNLTPNIKFKEKTSYTIQYTAKQTTGNPRLSVVYTDGSTSEFPPTGVISTSFTKYQITSDANKTIDYISEVYGSTATKGFYIKKNSVQIEQGTTATDYVAHEEQNISFPLAQGQKLMEGDYLADDGVHHVRGEVDLKDLTWTYTSDGNRFLCNNVSNLNIKGAVSDNQPSTQILSNIFTVRSNNGLVSVSNPVNYGIAITTTGLIRAKYTDTTDVNTFVTMLTNTNAILQYELAEEVIDPYTEEQQAVWEQIKALRTYKPVTHISSTDEVLATVDITYVRDWETVINNLSN